MSSIYISFRLMMDSFLVIKYPSWCCFTLSVTPNVIQQKRDSAKCVPDASLGCSQCRNILRLASPKVETSNGPCLVNWCQFIELRGDESRPN
jgi:hypothetical protein